MRIHTLTAWRVENDGSLTLLRDESYEYCGPVAEARRPKGEKKAEAEAEFQKGQARLSAQKQAELWKKIMPFLTGSLPGAGTAGEEFVSTPISRAQLGKDLSSIEDTYRGFGQFQIGQAGKLGRAQPAGGLTAAMNALARDRARAELGARLEEPIRAYQQGVTGAQIGQGFYGMSSPLPASQSAASGFQWLAKQPGLFSRIMKYAAPIASIVAAPFTGGASLAGLGGGFGSLFKKGGTALTSSSGVGSPRWATTGEV